jgi:hypothetical protein
MLNASEINVYNNNFILIPSTAEVAANKIAYGLLLIHRARKGKQRGEGGRNDPNIVYTYK